MIACGRRHTDQPGAAAQQGASEIEEVVMTARKLEEKIQDVPLTITAFTAGENSERGLDDVMDISQFTPASRLRNSIATACRAAAAGR